MPDITMCCNCHCPMRGKCYRYRAVPSPDWQSFALFLYVVKMNNKNMPEFECDHFWEVNEAADRTLPLDVVENRYDRDSKWAGLK